MKGTKNNASCVFLSYRTFMSETGLPLKVVEACAHPSCGHLSPQYLKSQGLSCCSHYMTDEEREEKVWIANAWGGWDGIFRRKVSRHEV